MLEPLPQITPNENWEALSLVGNPDFKTVVSKCNAQYLYWDKVKYNSGKFNPRVVWAALKLNRLMNTVPLKFGSFQLRFGVTQAMQENLHLFDLQMGGIALSPDDSNTQYYLYSSLMEEAIASSQMEGAVTTRKAAKEMLRKQEPPKNISQRMIVNNYQTICYLSEHKEQPLTPESLKFIHQMITDGTLNEMQEETDFRTSDDIVVQDAINGEIAHTPPKAKNIAKLVMQLCNFFNMDNSASSPYGFIHPVIKSIIIHFLLAWIHPFSDGNGRTARTLVYWYLLQKGYRFIEFISISRIIYRSKRQYEKAFLYVENDEGDLGYFLQYNLDVMKKAANEMRLYLERKSKERVQALDFMNEGLNSRQAIFIANQKKKKQNIITVKEYETIYGVANQTARSDLYDLVKKDLVKEVALNKRKVGFIVL